MDDSPKQFPTLLVALAVVATLSSAFGISAIGDKEASQSESSTKASEPSPSQTQEGDGGSGGGATPKAPPSPPLWPEQSDLYRQFFGRPFSAAEQTDEEKRAAEGRRLAKDGFRKELERILDPSYKLGFVVALVPDPRDSHLSYRFDESLDAIQKAYAEAGYLLDRAWLPWEGEPAGAPHRKHPGVLLFRRFNGKFGPGAERRLEAVLLVGESPKNGIHKEAFVDAVEIVWLLQSGGPVRVLGPTFSGSVESLRITLRRLIASPTLRNDERAAAAPQTAPFSGSIEALQAARPGGRFRPDLQFLVISGSATAKNLETYFDRNFGQAVWFGRTVVPDDQLTQRSFEFLQNELGWDLGRVVLMAEGDTAYGQPFDQDPGRTFRLIHFSSHLAHIRRAWEKGGLRQKQESPTAESLLDPARKPLDVDLADSAKPVDTVPEFTPLTTTTNDLALSRQLEIISQEGFRYVGIVATDIQDKLFLAEQIRTYCPNVVLFTFDNHLLDGHPEFASVMDGAIVLSSFPLTAEGEEGEHQQFQFTSDFHQGVYLAAGAILEPQRLELSRLAWVSAVSNGKPWPLARLAPGKTEPRRARLREGDQGVRIKWILAGAGLGLLGFWLWRLSFLQQAARRIDPAWRGSWITGWSRDAGWLSVLASGALWIAAASLLAFYSLPRREEWLSWAILAFLVLVYAGVTWLCARLSLTAFRKAPVWLVWAGWIVAGILLWIVLREAILALWVTPQGEDLDFLRISNFTSGLSPLVSLALLLAAVYLWAAFELRRRRLIALQALDWPVQAPFEAPLRECRHLADEVDGILERSSANWHFWAILVALLLFPMYRIYNGIQPISESPLYGWVFLALVGLGFSLSALSFFRFFTAWRKLERLLDRICYTWLLQELSAGSKAFDWRPMKSFGWRMPSFKMSVLSSDKLKELDRAGLLSGFEPHFPVRLENDLAVALAAERKGRWLPEQVVARRAVFDRLTRATRDLEELLGFQADPTGAPAKLIRQFLALRVVAYLRYVFAQLRSCLINAMMCALLVLVGVTLYAFEPKQFFSFGLWVTLLAGVLLTLWVFLQMDRNGALSAIGGTDAGKVSFDRTFVMNVFTYGVVPLVGVVVTQFPLVGRVFSQWLAPLLRVTGIK